MTVKKTNFLIGLTEKYLFQNEIEVSLKMSRTCNAVTALDMVFGVAPESSVSRGTFCMETVFSARNVFLNPH